MAKFPIGSPVKYWNTCWQLWRYGVVVPSEKGSNSLIPDDAVWAHWFDHKTAADSGATYVDQSKHTVHPSTHDEIKLILVKQKLNGVLHG